MWKPFKLTPLNAFVWWLMCVAAGWCTGLGLILGLDLSVEGMVALGLAFGLGFPILCTLILAAVASDEL